MNSTYEQLTNGLTQGPRMKNGATFDLENIANAFLDPKNKISCRYNSKGDLEVKVNHQIYNLSKILQYADFEQLQLDDNKLEHYPKFLQEEAKTKPEILLNAEKNIFPTSENFSNRDPEGKFNYLSYSEKLAINVYTGKSYSTINSFLRNNGKMTEFTKLSSEKLTTEIKEILLSTCIASSGLSKFDSSKIEQKKEELYRFEDSSKMMPVLNQRMEDIKTQEVSPNKSFVSTSKNPKIAGFEKFDTRLKLQQEGLNLIGKDISLLSRFPKEAEILLPPGTEIKFHQVEKDTLNGKKFEFEGIVVRTIHDDHSSSYSSYVLQSQELAQSLKKRYQYLTTNVQGLIENAKSEKILFSDRVNKAISSNNFDPLPSHAFEIIEDDLQAKYDHYQNKYSKYAEEMNMITGFLNQLELAKRSETEETQQNHLTKTVNSMKESGYIDKLKKDPHQTARKVLSVIGKIAAVLSIVGIGILIADAVHRQKYKFGLFDQKYQEEKKQKENIFEQFNSSESRAGFSK